jgi:hypothetical protein
MEKPLGQILKSVPQKTLFFLTLRELYNKLIETSYQT